MSDPSDNGLFRYTCPSCGVAYGLDKEVDKAWRKNGREFHCPNGHTLSYKFLDSSKELEALKAKVTDLTSKLESAKKETATYKQKVEELTNELEIWRPSNTMSVDSKNN